MILRIYDPKDDSAVLYFIDMNKGGAAIENKWADVKDKEFTSPNGKKISFGKKSLARIAILQVMNMIVLPMLETLYHTIGYEWPTIPRHSDSIDIAFYRMMYVIRNGYSDKVITLYKMENYELVVPPDVTEILQRVRVEQKELQIEPVETIPTLT